MTGMFIGLIYLVLLIVFFITFLSMNSKLGRILEILEKHSKSLPVSESEEQKKPETEWRCPSCGHINSPNRFTCEVCPSSKP